MTLVVAAVSLVAFSAGRNRGTSGTGFAPRTAIGPLLDFDTLVAGTTNWDFARTSGRQIAVDTSGRVHMAWSYYPPIQSYSHFVRYNSIQAGAPSNGDTGCWVGDAYGNGDQPLDMSTDTTIAVMVKGDGVYPWIFTQQPGDCSWLRYPFPSLYGGSSPRFAVQHTVDRSFYHMTGIGTTGLLYWRTPLGPPTLRQVEPGAIGTQLIVTSPVSFKVAIVFVTSGSVYYYESNDTGLTWGGGPGFGLRHSLGVTGAGGLLTAVYDYDDNLHVVYDEPGATAAATSLKHWSQAAGVTTVTQAAWDYPGTSNNINLPQLAVGTGTRLNNLYLVWSQYGTPQSGSDTAANGLMNANLFLSISVSAGLAWDPPRNLTNSPSPGCNGDCRSESGEWIAEIVDSIMHILYIRDLDAGAAVWSPEPTHTNNPVYYMRLRTPDPVDAPVLIGLPGAASRVNLQPGRIDTVAVPIGNTGTSTLTFTLTDTMPWLRFAPDPDSRSGTVPVGGPPDTVLCIIDAIGLAEGTYTGSLFVESNDPSIDNAAIPVALIVNSTFVASFRFGTSGGSGCWGWRAPDGTEYALYGAATGVGVVNATTLETVGLVPGPGPCGPSWREIKTYGHYAYAVSECTGLNDGMMIIDLQYLPDSVHLVGVYKTSNVTAHNLYIDTTKGFAYLIRPSYNGFRVISLANPTAPVEYPPVTTPNAHDLWADNDTVWVAEGNAHSFSAWNMASKTSAQLIARITIPSGGYVHNGWPTDDRHFIYTTEEVPAAKTVKIWDIQDLANVQLVGEYLGPSQLAHNAYAIGHYMVVAHYEAGLRVVDVANPSTPVEIASFDTYPLSDDPDYNGAWGAYPYGRGGRVYVSNMDGLLYILEFPQIAQCLCPCAGDPQCDGVRADVLDVVAAVNVAFRGIPGTADPGCPNERSDVDCTGATDVLDAVACVDVAFRGADPNARFCDPCLSIRTRAEHHEFQ